MQLAKATAGRSERLAVSLPADCRTPWGKIEHVVLSDISAEGCQVEATHEILMRGDHVLIRTSALLGASGTVRWVEAARAGIEFDSPLDGKVLTFFERNRDAGATIIVPCHQEPEIQPWA